MLLLSSPTFPTSLATCAYTHVTPGTRVLDLGAGEGKHAKMFRRQGGRVTAVDKRFGEEWGNMEAEPREGLHEIEWHAVSVVAIRTFTADPIPAYPTPLSHYSPADLKSPFSTWERVLSETMEQETNGHYFFFVDRAARRPTNENKKRCYSSEL